MTMVHRETGECEPNLMYTSDDDDLIYSDDEIEIEGSSVLSDTIADHWVWGWVGMIASAFGCKHSQNSSIRWARGQSKS